MCSNAGDPDPSAAVAAARLRQAIDELATAFRAGEDTDGQELAGRLASVWAMIAAADPELAERLARYSDS